MREIILFIAVFLSASFFAITSAQKKFCDTCKSLSISICPTEIPFGYETINLEYKLSKKISIGVEIGHIFPNKLIDKIIDAADPVWIAYSGTVIRLNGKYFLKNSNGAYISLLATYKDLSYSWHTWNITYSDEPYSFIILSEAAHVFGISFNWGVQHTISKHGRLDLFIGLGINNKIGNYKVDDFHCSDLGNRTFWTSGKRYIHDIGSYSENYFFPVAQAGIKIGLIYEKE